MSPPWVPLPCAARAPGLGECDLADIDRDDERFFEGLPVGRLWEDPVPGGDHEAGYFRVVGDVVRAAGGGDLDVVVVAPEESVCADVQRLLSAVRRQVAGPGHVQPPPF